MTFLPHNTVVALCEAVISLAWYGFWSVTVCCLTTLGVAWMKTRPAP